VVDDEASLADVLASMLRFEGWDARTAGDGATAVTVFREFEPDAVVLDVMLPDIDGFEVLKRLRELNPQVCVLFLTARDAVEDRIAGITVGGDDYVTKPFSLEELVARIRTILRRSGLREEESSTLSFADLELDEDTHEVARGERPIELTATEFRLLRYLLLNPRRVLTRSQILDHVWNYDFGGDARVLETYISYLRKKVDLDGPPLIHTVRGVGYALRLPRG
jgi:two-component system OmpR family response regulator